MIDTDTDIMSSYCLILLTLLVHFLPMYAQISSIEKLVLVHNEKTILWEVDSKISQMEVQIQRPETAKTTGVISYRGHTLLSQHNQHHLKNAHGVLILVGWGTLLPIGVIIARYCRKLRWKCNQYWFRCHIVCQTLGYIMGTIGWCIGLWLGSSSKQYVSKTQRALSIIAFTIINLQMLSIFMRPNKEVGYRKWWNMCHHALGYTVIGIVIANIFAGISNESEAKKLKWAYVGILGVLIVVAVPLQMFKCKSTIKQQFERMASSMKPVRNT